MNERSHSPDPSNHSFLTVNTRPSPITPAGLQLGALEVCHLRCPQGAIYPASEAYFMTMVWCVSGQFSLYIDEFRHTVRAGELLLIEPGGALSAEADEADNEAYYLLLDGPQANQLLQESGLWTGVFPYSRSPTSWLERIANEIESIPKQQTLASIGHSLLLNAAQDAAQCAPDRAAWEACCYIHQHWNKLGMNVEAVLRHLNVSRSTLSPRFRRVLGQSMLDYLMDIRYRNAVKMLHRDYKTISTIARHCGFPDASYFSTWFRKRSGASPRRIKNKR